MATYMICDGNGDAVTTGLREHEAGKVAQRLANERGEPLWLSSVGEEDATEIEVTPEAAALEVVASNPRPTSTGVERGMDVDVVATIGGRAVEGGVTLLPHAAGRPGYGSWGEPANWLSDGMLAAVSAAYPGAEFRRALERIEAVAAEAMDQ